MSAAENFAMNFQPWPVVHSCLMQPGAIRIDIRRYAEQAVREAAHRRIVEANPAHQLKGKTAQAARFMSRDVFMTIDQVLAAVESDPAHAGAFTLREVSSICYGLAKNGFADKRKLENGRVQFRMTAKYTQGFEKRGRH